MGARIAINDAIGLVYLLRQNDTNAIMLAMMIRHEIGKYVKKPLEVSAWLSSLQHCMASKSMGLGAQKRPVSGSGW